MRFFEAAWLRDVKRVLGEIEKVEGNAYKDQDTKKVYNTYKVYGDYYWEIDGNLVGCNPVSIDSGTGKYEICLDHYDRTIFKRHHSVGYKLLEKYCLCDVMGVSIHETSHPLYRKLGRLRVLKEWCAYATVYDTKRQRRYPTRGDAFPLRPTIYLDFL